MKRASMAREMTMVMRMSDDKEGGGVMATKGAGDEEGEGSKAMETATGVAGKQRQQ